MGVWAVGVGGGCGRQCIEHMTGKYSVTWKIR